MHIYLKEKIGNPELFTGRKRELTFYLNWIERIKQESSLSSAILSRRKTGKTALLQRLYNLTFEKNMGVIPFYYEVKEGKQWAVDFCQDFFLTFILQYIAYKTSVSEPTEVIHNDLRARFDRGEPAVVEAMKRFAQMTIEARQAILDADIVKLNRLIDQNFDLRRSICRLPVEQVEMVERARKVGATATFTGSGGAIVGTYGDDQAFDRLENELSTIDCRVLRLSTG